jgi:hypothetical protein
MCSDLQRRARTIAVSLISGLPCPPTYANRGGASRPPHHHQGLLKDRGPHLLICRPRHRSNPAISRSAALGRDGYLMSKVMGAITAFRVHDRHQGHPRQLSQRRLRRPFCPGLGRRSELSMMLVSTAQPVTPYSSTGREEKRMESEPLDAFPGVFQMRAFGHRNSAYLRLP